MKRIALTSLIVLSALGLAACDRHPSTLLASALEQVSWVYRAVTAIAEHVANIPFLFSSGERSRENLISSGPLIDFYDQPHRHINRFQYWELRVLWLMLRGECFRIPIYDESFSASSSSSHSAFRAPNSALKGVLILNPDHFHEIIQNHELVGWRYTGGSIKSPLESQVFLPEEVWFDKLPNPFNFWRGLSPLSASNLAASTITPPPTSCAGSSITTRTPVSSSAPPTTSTTLSALFIFLSSFSCLLPPHRQKKVRKIPKQLLHPW